ncbi:MAG: hypothetical protein ACO3E8_08290 [Candidatus Methylacidiphilales bacterium]
MARNIRTAAPAPQEPGRKPNRITARAAAAADGVDVEAIEATEARLGITARRRKLQNTTAGGPVRVVKVDPKDLATLTPAELKAALQAATVETVKPARVARPRVTLTPDAAAAFQELGWSLPFADTDRTYKPKPRERFNNSKGSAVYTLAVAALEAGPLSLSTLAQLWLASGNPTKKPEQITEQLAIRSQRPVRQIGDRLELITA